MKNIVKITLVSLLMLCPVISNAQVRYGLEISGGGSYYESNDYYYYEDVSCINMNFIAEGILPRKWTPNWLALSYITGIGMTSAWTDYDNDEGWGDSELYMPNINVPVKLEAKYLISNKIRFFANGGLRLHVGEVGLYDRENYDDGNEEWTAGFGTEFGAGFEFGFFRIGYQYTRLPGMMFSDNYDYKHKGVHGISMAFMFNGDRLLKKTSKLKMY